MFTLFPAPLHLGTDNIVCVVLASCRAIQHWTTLYPPLSVNVGENFVSQVNKNFTTAQLKDMTSELWDVVLE